MDKLKTRCFSRCVKENLSPDDCAAYIESEIAAAGGHVVGDIVIKVQEARNEVELSRSYFLVEVPVNIYGAMTCDRNDGETFYPLPWESADGTSQTVKNIDCLGDDAATCCAKVREYGKTTLGKDKNGNCLACFAHREPLIPKSATEFFEYIADQSAYGECDKVTLSEEEVQLIDDEAKTFISDTSTSLKQLVRNDDADCDDFETVLDDLYQVSAVIPPMSILLAKLACRYCYDEESTPFVKDEAFIRVIRRVESLLDQVQEFDGTEKTVIIYTGKTGKVADVPKLGGSRADEPYEEDCPPENAKDHGGTDKPVVGPEFVAGPCVVKEDCGTNGFCNSRNICAPYQGVGRLCYGIEEERNASLFPDYYGDLSLCNPEEAFCQDNVFCQDPAEVLGGLCEPWGDECESDKDCGSTEYCYPLGKRCIPKRGTGGCCREDSACVSHNCAVDSSDISLTGRFCA